jgi:hypothetical protein
MLAAGPPELQAVTLQQFVPLFQMIIEQYPVDGYKKCADTIMPIVEQSLYSDVEQIRSLAVTIVAQLRTMVQETEKEQIMAITLGLAHDESPAHREVAVSLLNELAPDMGQELCEAFIVPEVKSLGMDAEVGVRVRVV